MKAFNTLDFKIDSLRTSMYSVFVSRDIKVGPVGAANTADIFPARSAFNIRSSIMTTLVLNQ